MKRNKKSKENKYLRRNASEKSFKYQRIYNSEKNVSVNPKLINKDMFLKDQLEKQLKLLKKDLNYT